MKKITSKKLSKRVAQYGAFSIAIAGMTDANGQIQYTDIVPDHDQDMGSYLLNVNSEGSLMDAIDDFEIRLIDSSDLRIRPLTGNNEVLGNPYSSGSLFYAYPFALSKGDIISGSPSTGSWFNNSLMGGGGSIMDLNYSSCVRGNWCIDSLTGVMDKYLGLRFNIGGNTHYGWARLDVGGSGSNWVIKDYAYNTTPLASIDAGEGMPPLSINDNVFSNVKIVALNKSIALYNLPQQTNYRLFSITGQSVLNGKTDTNTHVIEANTLSSGIYIIELKNAITNAVMRKKIVL